MLEIVMSEANYKVLHPSSSFESLGVQQNWGWIEKL
jgi:hypothetical protein